MRRRNKRIGQIFSLGAAVSLLTACGSGDMSDLEQYGQEVLARKGGRIEPLPEIKPYERYLYQSGLARGRNPFRAFSDQSPQEAVAKAKDPRQQLFVNEIKNRNPEELERFELDSLRMVGTLQNTGQLWGIVVDSEGTVHKVRAGNYLGKNYGRILKITEAKMDLREILSDGEGSYQERQASLALREE